MRKIIIGISLIFLILLIIGCGTNDTYQTSQPQQNYQEPDDYQAPSQERTQPDNYCGDGICNSYETCDNCPADCGSCPVEESCKQVKVPYEIEECHQFDYEIGEIGQVHDYEGIAVYFDIINNENKVGEFAIGNPFVKYDDNDNDNGVSYGNFAAIQRVNPKSTKKVTLYCPECGVGYGYTTAFVYKIIVSPEEVCEKITKYKSETVCSSDSDESAITTE